MATKSSQVFEIQSTNVFPMANSVNGGQLVTEYNLRAWNSVGDNPDVTYVSGPSFTHSLEDFKITKDVNDPTIIHMSAGRALINGHYVESLQDIDIDLGAFFNASPDESGATWDFTKRMGIGLRAIYYGATNPNLLGSMVPENGTNPVYDGVQIIVGDMQSLKTPADSPNDESAVNVHLILASFYYGDVGVTDPIDNEARIQYVPQSRVMGDSESSDAAGLGIGAVDYSKLYVVTGDGNSSNPSVPKLKDVSTSLILWGGSKTTGLPPSISEARFIRNGDNIELTLPRVQPDGLRDDGGNRQYYTPIRLSIPPADYSSNTAGIVDAAYTQHIKDIDSKINKLLVLPNGRLVQYIEVLNDRADLPTAKSYHSGDYIVVGQDYTVAAADATFAPSTMYVVVSNPEAVQAIPCTLSQLVAIYNAVNNTNVPEYSGGSPQFDPTLPNYTPRYPDIYDDLTACGLCGSANSWQWLYKFIDKADAYAGKYTYTPVLPADYPDPATPKTYYPYPWFAANFSSADQGARYGANNIAGIIDGSWPATASRNSMVWEGSSAPSITNDSVYNGYDEVQQALSVGNILNYRDFIDIKYVHGDPAVTEHYFYGVSKISEPYYSEPIQLTTRINLATSEMVGGFLNPEMQYVNGNTVVSRYGQGYVILDDDGYLRVADYDLFLSGVESYRLGTDIVIAEGGANADTQLYLDEYVNDRVAFPTYITQKEKESSLVQSGQDVTNLHAVLCNINVTVPLVIGEDNDNVINIHDIDSRYNTSVTLNLSSATSNTSNDFSNIVINITNCSKIRIQFTANMPDDVAKLPQINVTNSSLYYDATLLDLVAGRVQDIKLWYAKFSSSDPGLLVDNNTVTLAEPPELISDSVSSANNLVNNTATNAVYQELPFSYGLTQLTFSPTLQIIGIGVCASSGITEASEFDIMNSSYIVHIDMTLAQTAFNVPKSPNIWALTNQVDGSFVQAYVKSSADPGLYRVFNINFSARFTQTDVTNPATPVGHLTFEVTGKDIISTMYTSATTVNPNSLAHLIDGWAAGVPHMFFGGVVQPLS